MMIMYSNAIIYDVDINKETGKITKIYLKSKIIPSLEETRTCADLYNALTNLFSLEYPNVPSVRENITNIRCLLNSVEKIANEKRKFLEKIVKD